MSNEKDLLEQLLNSESKITNESFIDYNMFNPSSLTNSNNLNSTNLDNSNSKSFMGLSNFEPKQPNTTNDNTNSNQEGQINGE